MKISSNKELFFFDTIIHLLNSIISIYIISIIKLKKQKYHISAF